MISIPRFPDLLHGLAPVIQLPREPEPVRFSGLTFYQRTYDANWGWDRPTRLYYPCPREAVLVWPAIQDIPGNPVCPAWRLFPDEVTALPHPAGPPWFAAFDAALFEFRRPFTFFADPVEFGESFVRTYEGVQRIPFPWEAINPVARLAVEGDTQSSVSGDTIETLVDLARDGKREDFLFLAGAAGVRAEHYEELWTGTRKRLGLP